MDGGIRSAASRVVPQPRLHRQVAQGKKRRVPQPKARSRWGMNRLGGAGEVNGLCRSNHRAANEPAAALGSVTLMWNSFPMIGLVRRVTRSMLPGSWCVPADNSLAAITSDLVSLQQL